MQTDRDLMTALIGDKLWQINFETHEGTEHRKPNGVFTDARAAGNRALSAVMHGHFNVLSFLEGPFFVVHHPFAEHPLPRGLFPFCEERYFDYDGEMVTAPATLTLRELFELSNGWPFFDDDPR